LLPQLLPLLVLPLQPQLLPPGLGQQHSGPRPQEPQSVPAFLEEEHLPHQQLSEQVALLDQGLLVLAHLLHRLHSL